MKFLDGKFGWWPRPWGIKHLIDGWDEVFDNGHQVEPWTGEPRLTFWRWIVGLVICARSREHEWGSWRYIVGTHLRHSYMAGRYCMRCNAEQQEMKASE